MANKAVVLGVSMSSHDRSAALLRDGTVVAAISEERLDRRKKSQGFYAGGGRVVLPPLSSITCVLREAGLRLDEVDLVVCGRSVTTCRADLLRYLPVDPDRVVEPDLPAHHLGHAYSAYFTAPYEKCDVLVIDEQGHWLPDSTFERCTWFAGDGGVLRLRHRFLGTSASLSLGMFFDVFAALTGLSEAGLPAAGKLMALAAYGTSRPEWAPLVELCSDGDAVVDLATLDTFLEAAAVPTYEGYAGWPIRTVEQLRLKYQPVHWGSALATDLARKAQDELETAVLHTATALRATSASRHLAYAGGVALNCTANARLREAGYDDVFVHPAATDDGVAVGLAAYGWLEVLGNPRHPQPRFHAHLGPCYPPAGTVAALRRYGLADHASPAKVSAVAELIAEGNIVCWFAGRSEWGPRALGSRSILADPTAEGIVDRLNSRVKFREPFRPFGLSVADAQAGDLLDLGEVPASLGPYMVSVAPIRDPRLRPVQHRDGTVRYQTVASSQGHYHELLLAMRKRIGLAAVLNTSFNTCGEPLVETPQDAVRQFLLCDADALYLDGTLIESRDLPSGVRAAALAAARADSDVDALSLALQQEAAGYPATARRNVDRVEPCLALGAQRIRDRAALLMRLALLDNDLESAVGHADEVLRWSGMPIVAAAAATTIARHGASPALPDRDAASLLAAMAPQGQALSTLQAVFGAPGTTPGQPW
jgi:carbamoyltransferase